MLPSPGPVLCHVYHSCPVERHALVIKIQGSRDTVVSYQSREDFKCCPGILVLELPRKAQHRLRWMEQCLLTKRRDRERSAPVVCASPWWLAGPPLSDGPAGLCAPLFLIAAEGPRPESCGMTQGCWQTYLSRTKELAEPQTGKDIPYKVINQA